MLDLSIFSSNEKSAAHSFDFDLIKFDCEPLTLDVESFLKFFFSFQNIELLRKSIQQDPYGKNGCVVHRFFYLTSLYKVAYNGRLYVNPTKLFPVAGKEQKAVYLLNFASAALYACLSNEFTNSSSHELYLLNSSMPYFVPFTKPDSNHWSRTFQTEVMTQSLIGKIQDLLMASAQLQVAKQSSELVSATSNIISQIFGPVSFDQVREQRRSIITKMIMNIFKTSHDPLNLIHTELLKKFPRRIFRENLFQFLQKCRNSLLSMTLENSSQPSQQILPNHQSTPISSPYPRKSKRHSLHKRKKKRRKLSTATEVQVSSESDVEICTFDPDDASLTQVPATNDQNTISNGGEWSPTTATQGKSNNFDDQEITSSLEKSEKGQESPSLTSSTQLAGSKKTYKFFRKPDKFFSQFQTFKRVSSTDVDIFKTKENAPSDFPENSVVDETSNEIKLVLSQPTSTPTPTPRKTVISLSQKVGPWDFSITTPKRTRIWKNVDPIGDNAAPDVPYSQIEEQLSNMLNGKSSIESSGIQIPFSQEPIETSTPLNQQNPDEPELNESIRVDSPGNTSVSIQIPQTRSDLLDEVLSSDPSPPVHENQTLFPAKHGLSTASLAHPLSNIPSVHFRAISSAFGWSSMKIIVSKSSMSVDEFAHKVNVTLRSIREVVNWIDSEEFEVHFTRDEWINFLQQQLRIVDILTKSLNKSAFQAGLSHMSQLFHTTPKSVMKLLPFVEPSPFGLSPELKYRIQSCATVAALVRVDELKQHPDLDFKVSFNMARIMLETSLKDGNYGGRFLLFDIRAFRETVTKFQQYLRRGLNADSSNYMESQQQLSTEILTQQRQHQAASKMTQPSSANITPKHIVAPVVSGTTRHEVVQPEAGHLTTTVPTAIDNEKFAIASKMTYDSFRNYPGFQSLPEHEKTALTVQQLTSYYQQLTGTLLKFVGKNHNRNHNYNSHQENTPISVSSGVPQKQYSSNSRPQISIPRTKTLGAKDNVPTSALHYQKHSPVRSGISMLSAPTTSQVPLHQDTTNASYLQSYKSHHQPQKTQQSKQPQPLQRLQTSQMAPQVTPIQQDSNVIQYPRSYKLHSPLTQERQGPQAQESASPELKSSPLANNSTDQSTVSRIVSSASPDLAMTDMKASNKNSVSDIAGLEGIKASTSTFQHDPNWLSKIIPFRLRFFQNKGENLNQHQVPLASLPLLISESVVNFILRFTLRESEIQALSLRVKKTCQELLGVLTPLQLERISKHESRAGVSVGQLQALPKFNLIYRTININSVSSPRYTADEINLIKGLLPQVGMRLARMAKERFDTLSNVNLNYSRPDAEASSKSEQHNSQVVPEGSKAIDGVTGPKVDGSQSPEPKKIPEPQLTSAGSKDSSSAVPVIHHDPPVLQSTNDITSTAELTHPVPSAEVSHAEMAKPEVPKPHTQAVKSERPTMAQISSRSDMGESPSLDSRRLVTQSLSAETLDSTQATGIEDTKPKPSSEDEVTVGASESRVKGSVTKGEKPGPLEVSSPLEPSSKDVQKPPVQGPKFSSEAKGKTVSGVRKSDAAYVKSQHTPSKERKDQNNSKHSTTNATEPKPQKSSGQEALSSLKTLSITDSIFQHRMNLFKSANHNDDSDSEDSEDDSLLSKITMFKKLSADSEKLIKAGTPTEPSSLSAKSLDEMKKKDCAGRYKGGISRGKPLYSIPPSTLSGRIQRNKKGKVRKRYANLSKEQEKYLSSWVIGAQTAGPITSNRLLKKLAEGSLQKNGDTRPLKDDWLCSFLSQNPQVKVNDDVKFHPLRFDSATPQVVEKFFGILSRPHLKTIPPRNRYAMSVSLIIEGLETNGLISGNSLRNASSDTLAFSYWAIIVESPLATDKILTPIVVAEGKGIQVKDTHEDLNFLDDWNSIATNILLSFDEILMKWVKDMFISQTKPMGKNESRILIVDETARDFAKDFKSEYTRNGINMLSLPPNTSHVLHPLNVSLSPL